MSGVAALLLFAGGAAFGGALRASLGAFGGLNARFGGCILLAELAPPKFGGGVEDGNKLAPLLLGCGAEAAIVVENLAEVGHAIVVVGDGMKHVQMPHLVDVARRGNERVGITLDKGKELFITRGSLDDVGIGKADEETFFGLPGSGEQINRDCHGALCSGGGCGCGCHVGVG